MVAFPLAHISWALADNALRPACDAFFLDVFGAQTASEMLITPETEGLGFDREERLMMVGDTMLIPIAPAGSGNHPDSGIGKMLRRSARDGQWIGLALRVADLPCADAWFTARGFQLHYDPGMEAHYFLIGPRQMMGVRLEVLVTDLPGDPRQQPGWTPDYWASQHPLGIEGLQAVGVSVASVEEARGVFGARLELPELDHRRGDDGGEVVAFHLGDTVIEAMVPGDEGQALAAHLRDIRGINSLTFKVRDAAAAAAYLRGCGLELIGDVAGRFAVRPDQAHGRLLWLTGQNVAGYPPLGSAMLRPAVFSS